MLPGVPHLRCLFHIYVNVSARLKSKLGDHWPVFKAAFNHLVHSIRTDEKFDQKWTAMIQAHPDAAPYLTKELLPIKEKWSTHWTNKYTTFGA
jgi:hypothetical protein